jgi:GNAT superfamily N-acetyltransferase
MGAQSGLLVREAAEIDAAALAALLTAFNESVVTPETVLSRLTAMKHTETVAIALSDGVAAGFCSVRIQPYLSEDQPYAEVTELFVSPTYRRKRIGEALMIWAENLAKTRGASENIILTGFKNSQAQDFYRHVGYADYALVMKKRIPARRE